MRKRKKKRKEMIWQSNYLLKIRTVKKYVVGE
jgi:hypothetical protein